MFHFKLSLISLICLAGCSTMAPKYSQPALPVPAEWPKTDTPHTASAKVDQKTTVDITWQEFFIDVKLQKLIDLAIKNNRDLKVAALNIERSGVLYQIQRNDLLPKVDATADAGFQRIPADLSAIGKSMTVEQYNIGLGISSYELDLFGRVRSLQEQALEQYLATEHAQRLSLIHI